MKALEDYGSLSELKAQIEDLQGERARLEKSKSKQQTELQELQKQEVETRGVIELYKELVNLGFDLATLVKLSKASEKYGGAEEVLESLNKYIGIRELESKLEQLEKKESDADSRLKKLQADHAHLKTIISMSEELLYKRSFSVSAIADIVEMARKYGEPMEAIKALNMFGSLKAIQAEIKDLSSKKNSLVTSIKELNDQLQVLRAQLDEVNKTLIGLFDPIRKEFEDSARLLMEKAMTTIEDISARYKDYSRKLAELGLRSGEFKEELRIASFMKAIVKYPSQIKDLPLDYDLLMIKGIAQHCRIKGVNPKVKFSKDLMFINELELH